jgi:5-deoxy-glucuronate isomerase
MISCGRVRKPIKQGITALIDVQLANLQFSVLLMDRGDRHIMRTGSREFAIVLVHGECTVQIDELPAWKLGPRSDPFNVPPHAAFITRDQLLLLEAQAPCLLGIGSAPAAKRISNFHITPEMVGEGERGSGSWTRLVRTVCWSDNTEGNMLLAGETCTPPGNWSTMPPHRHQYDIPGEECPYEEVYFFRFSRPEGFGLMWQFDDDCQLDQAYSLRDNDALFMGTGYHPVGASPASHLYHLSFMAGPRRLSRASVHPDYRYMLEASGLQNQYHPAINAERQQERLLP